LFSQQPIIHEMACQRCPAPPCSSPPRKCDYPKQSSYSWLKHARACARARARTVAHRPTHVHTPRTHIHTRVRAHMVWYGMVEVCEGAPVAVSGWVLTDTTHTQRERERDRERERGGGGHTNAHKLARSGDSRYTHTCTWIHKHAAACVRDRQSSQINWRC
jgi:hypothetical protein